MANGRKRNNGLVKGKRYFDDELGGITYKGFYGAVYNVDKEAAKELTKLNKLVVGANLNHKYFKFIRFSSAHQALMVAFSWWQTPQGRQYWEELHAKLCRKHYGDAS